MLTDFPLTVATVEIAEWTRLLLMGQLLVVLGGMALVFAQSPRHRVLAMGICCQGIVILFAASGAYYPRSELAIAAIAFLCCFCLWSAWTDKSRRGAMLLQNQPTTEDCVTDPAAPDSSLADVP